MKYLVYITLSFLLAFTSCKSTDKDNSNPLSTDIIDNENPPVLEFESTEFDFGTIAQGEMVSYTFKFKNTGKSDLLLNNVKPTCGCTVPKDWPKHPIAPGESSEIKVQYDGSGIGKVQKVIAVSANTKPAYINLYLKGNVVGPQ